MIHLFIYLLFITLLFIIYSEYTITNILFRLNSHGSYSIHFYSLFNFMIHPFYNSFLWSWKSLDINYAFILFYSLCMYYCVLN